jgi:hypothetical protein
MMILFTSRPMPREYAGRGTQKCEFYFSDRTLTDVLRFRESDAGRRPAGPQVGLSGHGVRKMLAVFIH